MKTVILCGGLGTRLSEETQLKPNPMIEIGGKPVLWHIMKIYEHYGYNDFFLALGYKGEIIKDYFMNYHARQSNLSVNLNNGKVNYSEPNSEDWNISLIDTGALTMTGGRLLRLKKFLKNSGTFMLTYGDGVSNINIKKAVRFHMNHGKIATITAVRPPVRFGELKISRNKVKSFKEKPQVGQGWINGGFFIFNNKVLNFIKDDKTMLEKEPLEKLTKTGQLMAFEHKGFWKCMDTMRDKILLNKLWKEGNALWKK